MASQITSPELLFSTVAVTFTPYQVAPSISETQVLGLLNRPLSIGLSSEGMTVMGSSRDQVEVALSDRKLDVREVSGKAKTSAAKIPKLIHRFIGLLPGPKIQSYGVNYVVDASVANAEDWLASSLLDSGIVKKFGLATRNVSLLLDKGKKKWTIKFEVRRDSRIDINFNASEKTSKLPSATQLKKELVEQWDALNQFLGELK